MQAKNNSYLIIIFLLLFIIVAVFFYSFKSKKDPGIPNQLNKIEAVSIPDRMDLAGEDVPLNKYYVREKLDRELTINTYWHSATILLLKKTGRWFPVIEPILREHGVPDDLKYLCLIESGLSNVVSPSGAAGYWQFLKGTAKDYGLEVDRQVDERYDVIKSTHAACRYLLDSYDKYHDWTLAAAAYNTGRKSIGNSIEKQKTNNYYDLYLNEETSRYIYRILAIKEIYENLDKYGFNLTKDDFYPPIPVKVITINKSVNNLADFAIIQGINYRLLKEFNPWLRSDKLIIKKGKSYQITIPILKNLD